MLRIKVGGVQKLVLEMETRPRTEPFRIHKVSATIYTKTQHNRISALSFFKARFFSHISLTEAFDTASSLATINKYTISSVIILSQQQAATIMMSHFYMATTMMSHFNLRLPTNDIHWVPITTSNLIHKNVLVKSGTPCIQTLMSVRRLFSKKRICSFSQMFVVTELVGSGTQCTTFKRYYT